MIGTIEQMIKDMAARKRGKSMRIVSQKDMTEIIDLPYERIGISQLYEDPSCIIGYDIAASDDNYFYLAKYSTQEKSEKAMQKLHNYYQERSVGVVFRFPQEDEICMKNSERIRSMTDEELAKFIESVRCYSHGCCKKCSSMNGYYCNGMKTKEPDEEILDWLKQPVED